MDDIDAPIETVLLPADPAVVRAIGTQHDLSSAVADLIDNSIDAGADDIHIRFVESNSHVIEILLIDNGHGMDRPGLERALTLGARRKYAESDLGYFGMGLKASSFSQADTLTVVSRRRDETTSVLRSHKFAQATQLSADVLDAELMIAKLTTRGVTLPPSGTAVLLTDLQTVSSSANRAVRRAWLESAVTNLRQRLGLIFHRFLDAELIQITIDVLDADSQSAGVPFHPTGLDPFAVPSGKAGYPITLLAKLGALELIDLRCHILAPGTRSPSARIFGRPREEFQGFFVYRNDRLLQAGGWGLVQKPSRDLQLARIAIDIPSRASKWFVINPEKNGVIFKPDLAKAIEQSASGPSKFSEYLSTAISVTKSANKRQPGIRPIAPMGLGFDESTRSVASEVIGFRDSERPISIRWKVLSPGRVFLLDLETRTVWMNERHRSDLEISGQSDPQGVIKALLFLLLHSYFDRGFLRQSTLDQVEAFQAVVAASMQRSSSNSGPFPVEDVQGDSIVEPSTDEPLGNSQPIGPLLAPSALNTAIKPSVPRESIPRRSADRERDWSPSELAELLEAYERTGSVEATSVERDASERDVAAALTRLMLWTGGPLDDPDNSHSDGLEYSVDEKSEIVEEYLSGHSIATIAGRRGRTQLAIGWLLLEDSDRPVQIPRVFRKSKALARRWAALIELRDSAERTERALN